MGKRHTDSKYSTILQHNVKMFCEIQGRKIKDVEKAIGVSKGYFVRCSQCRNSTGIDVICALAELFNVPIEDLITDAYEKRLQATQAKAELTKAAAQLSEAIAQAQDVINKEDILRIIKEKMEIV